MPPQNCTHPLFARFYTRISPVMDRQGAARHRHRLLTGLTGRVIEVGAGDGANFAYYPEAVSQVQAVEPEPFLRARAVERTHRAPVPVEVVDGLAECLPADDQAVDAVVISLMLCSVADQAPVLEEAFRVLRPGGQLRFYEHVGARSSGRLRTLQRIADATVWPLLFGGCHTGRDTAAAITAAGFVIDEIDRFDFPPGQPRRQHRTSSAAPAGPSTRR